MMEIEGKQVVARILHLHDGKYRILEGSHEGQIVDASDVISCDLDREPPPT
jgi:hypothetical protein